MRSVSRISWNCGSSSERAKNIGTWLKAGQMLGVGQRTTTLLDAGSRPVKLLDLPGGGGMPGITITFAPQINIEGNADKETTDQALMEAQERFQAWVIANFERLHDRVERERSRKAYA